MPWRTGPENLARHLSVAQHGNAPWWRTNSNSQQQGAVPAAMAASGAPAEVVEGLLEVLFTDLQDPQDAEVHQYLAVGLLESQDGEADMDELR